MGTCHQKGMKVRNVDGTQQASEMEFRVTPTIMVPRAVEHNYQVPECMEPGDFGMQLKVNQINSTGAQVEADLPPTPTLKRTTNAPPKLHKFVRIIIPTQAFVYRNIPSIRHR